MFARMVHLQLKPASATQFTQLVENEVIPLLGTQQGLLDHVAFVRPSGTDAIGITVWEGKESADAYHRSAYPDVLKTLANVVDGAPRLQSFKVSTRTWRRSAAR
jgi:hypothetical protein